MSPSTGVSDESASSVTWPWRQHLVAWLAYSLWFLALFLQWPVRGEISSNCDVWFGMALSNTYLETMKAALGGAPLGVSMYPVPSVLMYGETAIGASLPFLVLRLLGLDEIWALWGYNSCIFSLNAFGVYLLACRYVSSKPAAWFSGFAFSCSNLMFSHVDDSIVMFYLLPALAWIGFLRHYRDGRPRAFLMASALAGAQVYFSVYVFIYQFIAYGVLFASYALPQRARVLRRDGLLHLMGAGVFTAVALPFFAYYLWAHFRLAIVDPFPGAVARLSLTVFAPFLVLPNNLLYGGQPPAAGGVFFQQYCFMGLLLLLLAGMAVRWRCVGRGQLLVMALLALLLALGPVVNTGILVVGGDASAGDVPVGFGLYLRMRQSSFLVTPLALIYRWFPLFGFLRTAVRAYFLVSLCTCLLAGMGLAHLLRRLRWESGWRQALLVSAAVVIHGLENIPWPLHGFQVASFIGLSEEYRAFTAGKHGLVLVDLPTRFTLRYLNWDPLVFDRPADYVFLSPRRSRLKATDGFRMFERGYETVFEYNRDAIYMNWQTHHRQNIVGGLNGYFPASRLVFQQRIMELPRQAALTWLKREGVTHLVFHKDMVLPGEEDQLAQLGSSPWLIKVQDGPTLAVFEVSGMLGAEQLRPEMGDPARPAVPSARVDTP